MNQKMTIDALIQQYINRERTVVEHVQDQLARIEQENDIYGGFTQVFAEDALAQAQKIDQLYQQGMVMGPLQGITVGVKDVIHTQNAPITLQTELYSEIKSWIPQADATAVRRLKEAGAIIIGKTNTHEMGMGPTGDVGYGPIAKNPVDPTKVSGGSSSGSAVAVARGWCDVALGTDTGGSIRLPSALSGVVGMKPTFGRVSNVGMVPLAYSCDAMGPMTRTVRDNAKVLSVMAGYDPQDMYSLDRSDEDFERLLNQNPLPLRVGVPFHWLAEPLHDAIRQMVTSVVDRLQDRGVEIVNLDASILPTRAEMATLRADHQLVLISEAFQAHQAELSHPGTFAQQIYDRLLTGDTRTCDYVAAYQQKNTLQQIYKHIYQHVDMVLTPSVMTVACDLFQDQLDIEGEINTTMKAYTEFTWIDSFTGYPSLAIPTGTDDKGLPVGILLNGPMHSESRLYQVGGWIERVTRQ